MKSTWWNYKYAMGLGVFAAVAAWTIPGAAQNKASAGGGKVEEIMVHGRSLEGNLEGDSPDRTVAVYLPPSYSKERNRRYPVVYLLHRLRTNRGRLVSLYRPAGFHGPRYRRRDGEGNDSRDSGWQYSVRRHMYSSSPTTGDWEAYITHDLVSYIDSHYRTIANRNSRGLGGHSMGGYGVWRLG